MNKTRVGLIGNGAIGSELVKLIKKDKSIDLVFVFDELKEKSSVKSIEEGLGMGVDLVVECASKEAVVQFAQKVLCVCSLAVLSTSAFGDKKFEEKVKKTCLQNNTMVFAPPGAIIGLDGLRAVKKEIVKCMIITTKHPAGFGRLDKAKKILFDGSARRACLLYPKNVNVAATLSLAGIGFDKTKARIISDPAAKANTHEIIAEGKFGKFFINVENRPSKNPKTSALAAKTTFEFIKSIQGAPRIYP